MTMPTGLLKTLTMSTLRRTTSAYTKRFLATRKSPIPAPSITSESFGPSLKSRKNGMATHGERDPPRVVRCSDKRSKALCTRAGPRPKVDSKTTDGAPMARGKKSQARGMEPVDTMSGETGEDKHATRFRSMISEFRTVKKEAAVQEWSPSRDPGVDTMGRSFGLGRRKTSLARVWITLSEGKGGLFMVNKKPMIEYFVRDYHQNQVLKPLDVVDKVGHFHVRCTATGGGLSGQAGAIRLGLARALEAHEPWWRKELKKEGLMTRDARKVERKKPGLKKARKASQWVKR